MMAILLSVMIAAVLCIGVLSMFRYRDKKKLITYVITSIICLCLVVSSGAIILVGFIQSTENSTVVADVKIDGKYKDLFYDDSVGEYFYIDIDPWRVIYPHQRVVIEHDAAVDYIEQFQQLPSLN